jgi:hypothetical protein
MFNRAQLEVLMPVPPPYKSLEEVKKLAEEGNVQALRELAAKYAEYYAENACVPIDGIKGWSGLGAYFLDLARKGSDGMKQTRAEFEAATKGLLKQPVPYWITNIEYIQTDPKELYYLALPPQEMAEQAYIHARNPVTDASSYVTPPIYDHIDATLKPEQILNTRICDYVISHCA